MSDDTRYGPIAERLRAYYRRQGIVPPGSDYELVQQALRSETTDPRVKDVVQSSDKGIGLDQHGIGTSFLKGVGRGLGGDLVTAGIDAVAGTNTKSYLEDPSVNESWTSPNALAATGGNIVGGIAGLMTPTGLAGLGIKGVGTAGKLARALIGSPTRALATRSGTAGALGTSQALGTQRDQQERGQRESLDPMFMAAQGGLSAATFGAGEKWLRPFATQASKARLAGGALTGGEAIGGTGIEAVANQTSSVTPEGRSELSVGPQGYGIAALVGSGLGGVLGKQMAKGAATDAEFFEGISEMLKGRRPTPPPPAPTPSAPAPPPPSRTLQSPDEIFPGVGQKRQRIVPTSPVPPANGIDDLEWMSNFGGNDQPFLPGMTPERTPGPALSEPLAPVARDIHEFDPTAGKASLQQQLENERAKKLLAAMKGEDKLKKPYVTTVKAGGQERLVTVIEDAENIKRFIDQQTGEVFQEGHVDFHPTKQPRWYESWDNIDNMVVPPDVQLQVVPEKVSALHGVKLKGGGTASLVGRPSQENPLDMGNPKYYGLLSLPDGSSGYGFVHLDELVDPDVIKNALRQAEMEEAGLARKPVPPQIQEIMPAGSPQDTDQILNELMELIRQRRPNQ